MQAQFEATETRLGSVLDSALDAIITADAEGLVQDWNPAAERMFGYTRQEALGHPLDMIIPERFREAHRAGMRRVANSGPSRVTGKTVEVAAVRRDGSEVSTSHGVISFHRGRCCVNFTLARSSFRRDVGSRGDRLPLRSWKRSMP